MTKNELIDPKESENIICTTMKHGETFLGDHTVLNTKILKRL